MFLLYSGPCLLVSLCVVDVILSLLHVAVICRRVCRAWFWPWLHVLACWTLPWVPEFFLVCDGNFRCWPKADTSSAVGRSHEFRAGHYKDFTETGNCAGKVSGTQGSWTRPCYIFRCVCRTWFSRCNTFLLHAPVWLLHVILLMFYVSFTRPGVCTALDSPSVTGPVSCRSGCTARGFVAFSLSCASWPFVNCLRIS